MCSPLREGQTKGWERGPNEKRGERPARSLSSAILKKKKIALSNTVHNVVIHYGGSRWEQMCLKLEGGCRKLKKDVKKQYLLSTLSHPETHEKQKMDHLTFASKHLNVWLKQRNELSSKTSTCACFYKLFSKSERLHGDWIKNAQKKLPVWKNEYINIQKEQEASG